MKVSLAMTESSMIVDGENKNISEDNKMHVSIALYYKVYKLVEIQDQVA